MSRIWVGSSSQAQKRPRLDDETHENAVVLKSADLWLHDGNIVLRAVAPHSHTLYKVHKSVLSLHSSVFRDLFDGPQTAFDAGSEWYDGVPVMEMPDVPGDVGNFLKALYFSEYISSARESDPSISPSPHLRAFPEGYAGALRLATKYDAKDIRKLTVAALQRAWPASLKDWDVLQHGIELVRDGAHWDLEEDESDNVSELYLDPAEAVRLATDCDVPDVLPVAFYDLARIHAFQSRGKHAYVRYPDMSLLTADELRRLLSGMGALRTHFTNAFLPDRFLTSWTRHTHSCKLSTEEDPWPCRRMLHPRWVEVWERTDERVADVFGWLNALEAQYLRMPTKGVCKPCERWMHAKVKKERKDLWLNLPKCFDLIELVSPTWGK